MDVTWELTHLWMFVTLSRSQNDRKMYKRMSNVIKMTSVLVPISLHVPWPHFTTMSHKQTHEMKSRPAGNTSDITIFFQGNFNWLLIYSRKGIKKILKNNNHIVSIFVVFINPAPEHPVRTSGDETNSSVIDPPWCNAWSFLRCYRKSDATGTELRKKEVSFVSPQIKRNDGCRWLRCVQHDCTCRSSIPPDSRRGSRTLRWKFNLQIGTFIKLCCAEPVLLFL